MTDRELLELAAKAIDMTILCWDTERSSMKVPGSPSRWNPLTDDGDALRLAVKLDIDVFFQSDEQGRFTSAEGSAFAYEYHKEDPDDATRRAIVRAAASIGRNKEQGDGGGV